MLMQVSTGFDREILPYLRHPPSYAIEHEAASAGNCLIRSVGVSGIESMWTMVREDC